MRLDRNALDDLLDLVSTYRYHFIAMGVYAGLIVAALLYVDMAMMPKYDEKATIVAETNQYNGQVRKMEASGLSSKEFAALAKTLGSNPDDPMFKDMPKIDAAILKPASYKGAYLAWLEEEVKLSDKRNDEIGQNTQVLRSILPSFVSANRSLAMKTEQAGETLTLENFTQYVETNLLKRFGIESSSPIGIDSIDFKENKAGTSNIGAFRVNIDFQGDIRNVRKMLEFLQASGRLVVRDGRLLFPDGVPLPSGSGLSDNLLVNVTDFAVSGWLPPDDPSLNDTPRVTGTVSLEFYVQGRSTQEVLLMRKRVMDRYKELTDKIKGYDNYCNKPNKCKTEDVRLAVASIQDQYAFLFGYDDQIKGIKMLKEVSDVNQEINNLTIIDQAFSQVDALIAAQEKIITPSK